MAEAKTYEGSCHCGAVKWRVTAALEGVMECNCSHCWRKGFRLTFVPPEQFELVSGADALREYRFNKKAIAHLFCTTCGVESFARGVGPGGKPMIAINTRCLEDHAMAAALPAKHVDGRSF
jgi:hypothetical protein